MFSLAGLALLRNLKVGCTPKLVSSLVEVVPQCLSSRGTHNLRRLSPKASLAEAPTTLKSRSSLLLGLACGLRRDLAAQPLRTVLLGSGVSTVIETLAKLLEVYQQI